MGAQIPYKIKARVTLETELEWSAVTSEDAICGFNRAIEDGSIGISDLGLDWTKAKVEAVIAE